MTRTLKIETAGDYWRGQVSPKIRLAGQWLERAGFKPGNRVEIVVREAGTLTLRFLDCQTIGNNGTNNGFRFQQTESGTEVAQRGILDWKTKRFSHHSNNKKPLNNQGFETVVAGAGIEPATQGFSVLCSTN